MNAERKRQALLSVFPPTAHTDTITEASPYLGRATLGSRNRDDVFVGDDRTDQSSAWSVLTLWLSVLPGQKGRQTRTPDTVLAAAATILSSTEWTQELLTWHSNEVRKFLEQHVQAPLREIWLLDIKLNDAISVVNHTINLLWAALPSCIDRVDTLRDALRDDPRTSQYVISGHASLLAMSTAAKQQVQALPLRFIPVRRLQSTLAYVFHNRLMVHCVIEHSRRSQDADKDTEILLFRLKAVGLGGAVAQRAFAQAVHALIEMYIHSPQVRVDWYGRTSVVNVIREWVRHDLCKYVVYCLSRLNDHYKAEVPSKYYDYWQRRIVELLGKYRVRLLFDYVKTWPHSTGAILDLKEYITTPEAKAYLATQFVKQLAERILHAGAQTSDLLSVYVNVIYVFKTLDPRGVLLEKIAHPLRHYLREREDTVRVIAASFLADLDADGNVVNPSDDVCADIAKEVGMSENQDMQGHEKGLDWDDMAWLPDPIDAGPDFRKSKNEDIVSYMLTLFEQDDFIKEVQSILGERLLRAGNSDLEKEIRLVELFKSRFGQDKLQTCEVMLRDVQDSARLMKMLRPRLEHPPTPHELWNAIPENGASLDQLTRTFSNRLPEDVNQFVELISAVATTALRPVAAGPAGRGEMWFQRLTVTAPAAAIPNLELNVQILSSFFWPALRDDEFAVPDIIANLQARYARDFERIKKLRKLQWRSALGRATIELELEDRTIRVDNVRTWQASIIHAFQDDSSDDSMDVTTPVPVTRTVGDLATTLEMDELLVRDALGFWTGQRALIETAPDTYAVLERLPPPGQDGSAISSSLHAQPVHDAAISAVKSQNAVLLDNKDMYEMFMIGMLTNGGAMDAARIAMMLKLTVPGWVFGEEEVLWLLADLVEQGKCVQNGSVYSIKK